MTRHTVLTSVHAWLGNTTESQGTGGTGMDVPCGNEPEAGTKRGGKGGIYEHIAVPAKLARVVWQYSQNSDSNIPTFV